MIEITNEAYKAIAAECIDLFGQSSYFHGRIEYECAEYYGVLELTTIIYRKEDSNIAEIVPVWWAFTATTERGEQLTDFAFSEVRKYLEQ